MITLRKPSAATVQRFLDQQVAAPFSYQGVGSSAGQTPQGYIVDHTRVLLGHGEAVYQAACAGVRGWQQFNLGWVLPGDFITPIQSGQTVAVMGHAVGLWWLNACRIVYVIDETGPIARFGFAYGTLPSHAERGEERFQIEWHRHDDGVWYDILAFSRPNLLVARLGYPLVRRQQKRFARDSAAAMQRVVQNVASTK